MRPFQQLLSDLLSLWIKPEQGEVHSWGNLALAYGMIAFCLLMLLIFT